MMLFLWLVVEAATPGDLGRHAGQSLSDPSSVAQSWNPPTTRVEYVPLPQGSQLVHKNRGLQTKIADLENQLALKDEEFQAAQEEVRGSQSLNTELEALVRQKEEEIKSIKEVLAVILGIIKTSNTTIKALVPLESEVQRAIQLSYETIVQAIQPIL